MANIKSVNGNPIVLDGNGLDTSVKKAIGGSVFEYGYIQASNSTQTINPNSATVLAAENTKHVFVECSYGDVFDISVNCSDGARSYVLIAGPDYSTPYKVLTSTPSNNANKTIRTFLVVNDVNAKYVLFQNNFANNPSGHVRKVSMNEFATMRQDIDWDWVTDRFWLDGRYVNASGAGTASDGYVMTDLIPVRYGDLIDGCLAGASGVALAAFYGSNMAFKYAIVGGEGQTTVSSFSFEVPESGFVRFSTYYPASARDSATGQYAHYRLSITPTGAGTEEELLAHSYEQLEFLRSSRGKKSSELYEPITIMHLSDLHADTQCMKAMACSVAIDGLMGDYVDDIILTGDITRTDRNGDITPITRYGDRYRHFMLALGNHDVRPSESSAHKYPDSSGISAAYTKFFDGRISQWGVTTDSATSYPTYYYKDYADSGLRLVVLDSNMDASIVPTEYGKQLEWLVSTLADARANSLAVMVAQHFPVQGTPNVIDCQFTDLIPIPDTEMSASMYCPGTVRAFQAAVQDFIDAGGEFVCHIAGHTHADFIYTSEDYPDQLCVIIGTASGPIVNSPLSSRTVGKSKFLFNTITVSRSVKQFRIVRFGAEANMWMARKLAICIDYDTKQIVREA